MDPRFFIMGLALIVYVLTGAAHAAPVSLDVSSYAVREQDRYECYLETTKYHVSSGPLGTQRLTRVSSELKKDVVGLECLSPTPLNYGESGLSVVVGPHRLHMRVDLVDGMESADTIKCGETQTLVVKAVLAEDQEMAGHLRALGADEIKIEVIDRLAPLTPLYRKKAVPFVDEEALIITAVVDRKSGCAHTEASQLKVQLQQLVASKANERRTDDESWFPKTVPAPQNVPEPAPLRRKVLAR